MKIEMYAIGTIRNECTELVDDQWKGKVSSIELNEDIAEDSLEGITAFSHVSVLFYMHKVPDEKAVARCRHPRNNKNLPKVGTFAQRNKSRPNKIGLSVAKVLSREANRLTVLELDAIDGTPVLDIKPVMKAFLPREEIIEPDWVEEITGKYWD